MRGCEECDQDRAQCQLCKGRSIQCCMVHTRDFHVMGADMPVCKICNNLERCHICLGKSVVTCARCNAKSARCDAHRGQRHVISNPLWANKAHPRSAITAATWVDIDSHYVACTECFEKYRCSVCRQYWQAGDGYTCLQCRVSFCNACCSKFVVDLSPAALVTDAYECPYVPLIACQQVLCPACKGDRTEADIQDEHRESSLARVGIYKKVIQEDNTLESETQDTAGGDNTDETDHSKEPEAEGAENIEPPATQASTSIWSRWFA